MKKLVGLALLFSACGAVCWANTLPFGVASAYNLVALGTVDGSGNTVIAGNISTNADVTGRVAAAGMVLSGTTIGSSLNADPYGSAATFDLVSTGGLNAGETFNINSHGDVYAPGTNGNFNFGQTGEVHNDEFTGTLPFDPSDPGTTVTPEPSTLALLGTGLLSLSGLVRRRLRE